MTCRRTPALVALALAATLLATSAPAAEPMASEPMSTERLRALHEAGLDDDTILELARREGFASPLTSSDVLDLREAGLDAGFLSRLVTLSAEEPLRAEERDGVTVLTGRGSSDEPTDQDIQKSSGEPEIELATAPQHPPQVIIVQAPAPAPEAPADASPQAPPPTQGYPVGATFGWTGGAVFLPAHFGGSDPSAFGRTIVDFSAQPGCCAPVIPMAPAVTVQPKSRQIPIRTSRGLIYVPN